MTMKIKNGCEVAHLFLSQKMNSEMWAVAISNVLFGFVAGMAVENIMNCGRFVRLNMKLQHAIDSMFAKDKKIDELSKEISEMNEHYEELYNAIQTSQKAFATVKRLSPPNSPISRCEHYKECVSPDPDFPNPQTPTCESSSTD